MLLCVTSPTSYLADGPFVINDKFGDIFYSCKSAGTFNLPAGDYNTVSGSIIPEEVFTPFPSIPQDDPIRKTGMSLEVGVNPNKATFYAKDNKAVFDGFIIRQPFKPARVFCMCHEEGHTYYRPPNGTMEKLKNPLSKEYKEAYKDYLLAECRCDIYAYNKMVRNGYNPSQVRTAIRLIFRPDNERLMLLDKQILEVNNNKIV